MGSLRKVLTVIGMSFVVLVNRSALAGVGFSVVGAGSYSLPSSSSTVSSKIGFGGGALLDFSLGPKVGIELGGLYMLRKFGLTVSTVNFTAVAPAVQIPVVLRLHLLPALSIGAGGYAAMGMGNVTFTSGATEIVDTYANNGLKTLDYGLLGSIGLNIKLASAFSFILDSRFLFGLAEQSDSTGSVKYRELQGLAGFRFGM